VRALLAATPVVAPDRLPQAGDNAVCEVVEGRPGACGDEMPEIEYELDLDDAQLEWLRLRVSTRRGSVIAFVVQYETTIDGQRVPVVRYDDHHGFPHKDVLNRRGDVVRIIPIDDQEPGIVVTRATQDILANWFAYRAEFFGDEA
jgi:hypothetical protein